MDTAPAHAVATLPDLFQEFVFLSKAPGLSEAEWRSLRLGALQPGTEAVGLGDIVNI